MRRREFIILAGGAAGWPLGALAAAAMWPFAARAQQPKTPVIGFLSPGSTSVSHLFDGLREGLKELGYIDGQSIRIETRWADGRFEKLPQLAIELVHLNVEVLVASLTQASLEAKKATATIPIVMAGVGDPAAVGLIASLSHPGGNVTGTSSLSSDIVEKQLELLKEVFPGASGVAVLWNPANASFQALQLKRAEQAAKAGGLQLQLLEARSASEFDAVFERVEKGTRALAVLGDPLFAIYAKTIAALALKHGLAAVSAARESAAAGILLTYGPSLIQSHKRAAMYVDKILKGAKPSDLPVEQPIKFELAINLKTAKALGLAVPPSLLARADEVIE